MPKLEPEGFDDGSTAPGDARTAGPTAHEEVTRQASEDELRLLHGADVTRQVPEEELLPLRARSTETQQVTLSDLEPLDESDGEELDLAVTRAPDGTFRSALPSHLMAEAEAEATKNKAAAATPDDSLTEPVMLLEHDAMKTTEVPRLAPEIPLEPVTPAAGSRAPAARSGEETGPTPLPPPSPAAPSLPQAAEDFGDEHLRTNRIDRLDPAELKQTVDSAVTKPGNRLKPAARELVVPDRPAPPRQQSPLPKIEVSELPVERPAERPPAPSPLPSLRPPSPSLPAPPPARPAAPPPPPPSLSSPPSLPPPLPFPPAPAASLAKPQRPVAAPYRPVAPPAAHRPMTSSAGIALLLLAFFGAVAGIGIGVLHHMHSLRQERERIEKQRLADQLNAQAEALRRATPPPAAPAPTAAPPIVTHPDVPAPPAPRNGPCPLGANLVQGRAPYCIDVYEYPGGRTIPRTSVSFDEAQRLCSLRGERLCTEVEWERACRGKGGASYPYGQSYDVGRCNTRGGEIEPAGSFKDCRSGIGAYDMSGNVAEWVITQKGNQPVQKGGSALQANPYARCSSTVRGALPEGGPFVGFRCCADPK